MAASDNQTDNPVPSPPLEVRADPERLRVARGLKKASKCRIWLVAQHFFGRSDHTVRDILFDAFRDNELINPRHRFNRLLKNGPLFSWDLAPDGRASLHRHAKAYPAWSRPTSPARATNLSGQGDHLASTIGHKDEL